ncbi:MAG: M15 family metallopeptidase [Flavobacteriaceae bacterium]|nr:M15 family metallopeptidase [Flavobacteriaceae bacterium]
MIKNLVTILLFVICITQSEKEYTLDDLIGKGTPEFYGEGYQLQKEAYNAFLLMKESALKNGIDIEVVSSYRSFEHQKRIWTRKYKKFTSEGLTPTQAIQKIIEYSTIPGTSRHHWGTDVDMIDRNKKAPKSVLNPENFIGSNVYSKLRIWLEKNANKFGFYLAYTNEISRKGFKYEPWHYSYKPISKPMLRQYLKIDIQELLKTEKLLGSEYFTDAFITKYITENICDINCILK